jgi:c-di-GMP-binding flagellar brake protein YcgR
MSPVASRIAAHMHPRRRGSSDGMAALMSRMARIVTVSYLPAMTVHAQSESLLRQIRWKHADSSLIIIIVITGIVIAAFFVFWYVWRRYKVREDSLSLSQDYFDEYARKFKLTRPEISMLRRLLTYENVLQQQTIFQSIYLFERCVHAHMETLRHGARTGEEAAQDDEIIASLRKKIGFGYIPLEHPLVSTRNIEIGVRGGFYHHTHSTKLLDSVMVVKNTERSLFFSYDEEEQDSISIASGDMLRFTFFRKNDGIYEIPCQVLQQHSDGTIEVTHTLDFKRSQRRKYVRLEKMFTLRVRLIKTRDPEKSEVKVGTAFECRGVDIGGGGVSFLSEQSLKAGDMVSLSFGFGGRTFSGVRGTVLRISLQEGKTTTLRRHHVKFVHIEPHVQEQIIKFIFQQQRQQIQWR